MRRTSRALAVVLLTCAASPAGAERPLWSRYLGALSGLEGGYLLGRAWVSSETRDRFGRTSTIASGRASSRGYKISAFTPPAGSGLFIYPTLGFFSLDIDIADPGGDAMLGNVAGARDLRALGSDPLSGEPIDLAAPNVYRLELRSAHLGQRAGGSLVFGGQGTQLFVTLELDLNLLEWRHTRAQLGPYAEGAHSAELLRSAGVRAQIGVVHRPWHMALRCEGNYEYYARFSFPRPLPFEGPSTYNAWTDAYERPEVEVEAASVHTANLYCGVSFVY